MDYPQSAINNIRKNKSNYKPNDFSYDQRLMAKFIPPLSQIKYVGDDYKIDSEIKKKNFQKSYYATYLFVKRYAELDHTIKKVRKEIKKMSNFSLTPEELDALNSLPDVEEQFNDTKNNIRKLDSSITNLQREIDELNAENSDSYRDLYKKQLDIMRYQSIFNHNFSDITQNKK